MRTARGRTPATNSWLDVAICLGILVAVWVAYGRVGHFDFLSYDDPTFVTSNVHVRGGLTADALAWAFTSTYAANWLPLTWLSYTAGFQLYGLDAGWQHLTNVLIHATSALLLYAVFRIATGARWCSAFVAYVFALHPVHVEAVAWISERKELLSGLFWFLTIWIYLLYVRKPRAAFYLFLILSFACGLMSKPMIVTLPFVLLLLDVWPLKRFEATPLRRIVIEKIPLLALSAAACVITFAAQKRGGAVSNYEIVPFVPRIQNALVSYVGYIFKFFWPTNLSIVYPFSSDLPLWQVVCAGLLLAGFTALAIWQSKQRPYLAVGWFWFTGTLIPVIGLVQVGVQSSADRYTYVPYVGLSIILGWGAGEVLASWRWRKPALVVGLSITYFAYLLITIFNVDYWRNGVTIFEHAVSVAPQNWVAQSGLAQALLADGRVEEAIPHARQSILLQPNSAESHVVLADALNKTDDLRAAENQFRIALQLKPDNPDAQEGLGMMLTERGQVEEAYFHLTEAIRLRPEDADSHYNLGRLYGLSGRTKEAISEFAEAVRLEPRNAEAHYNLGTALAIDGRFQDAYREFETAVRIRPDYGKAHVALGGVLAQLGRCDEAASEFRQATSTEFDSAEVTNLLNTCATQRHER